MWDVCVYARYISSAVIISIVYTEINLIFKFILGAFIFWEKNKKIFPLFGIQEAGMQFYCQQQICMCKTKFKQNCAN